MARLYVALRLRPEKQRSWTLTSAAPCPSGTDPIPDKAEGLFVSRDAIRTAAALKQHWHSSVRDRYKKAGWCTRVLAPPPSLTLNPRTKLSEDEAEADYNDQGALAALQPAIENITLPQPNANGGDIVVVEEEEEEDTTGEDADLQLLE